MEFIHFFNLSTENVPLAKLIENGSPILKRYFALKKNKGTHIIYFICLKDEYIKLQTIIKNKEQKELIILKIIDIILYIGETMNLKKRGNFHLKKNGELLHKNKFVSKFKFKISKRRLSLCGIQISLKPINYKGFRNLCGKLFKRN